MIYGYNFGHLHILVFEYVGTQIWDYNLICVSDNIY